MPACLPKPLVVAAGHPSEGLAALHGPAGQAVFPEDVAPLVDLSGKKWAHTAVVALPFPGGEAGCRRAGAAVAGGACHVPCAGMDVESVSAWQCRRRAGQGPGCH